jgi:DNA-binding CsgD family transcriptional regulator
LDETLNIGGIKFTNREVYIISCLSNGLPVKDIGVFLNISPNTANTHIRNVMQKIGTSSQRGILKFLESSEQHITVHKKYIDLLVLREFEKLLEEIAELQRDDKKTCFIHVMDKNLCEEVYRHLKPAGVHVDILECTDFSKIEFSKKHFHIVCTTPDALNIKTTNGNVVILLKNGNETLLYRTNADPIDNYYFAVLYCIEQIYNSEKIENPINNFKKYCIGKQKVHSLVSQHDVLEITTKKFRYSFFIILLGLVLLLIYKVINHVFWSGGRPVVSRPR